MRYTSILMLPLPMVVISACHHILGPEKTVQMSAFVSDFIASKRRHRRLGIEPEDFGIEMKILQKLMPKPWLACLEQACAFEIWLAFHGQASRVCIGKRVECGRLLMHAWLETEPAPFFYDDRFVKVDLCVHGMERDTDAVE